jgi:hypothetical protein
MEPKLILSYASAFFVIMVFLGAPILPLSIACGAFIFLAMVAPRLLIGIFRQDL